jgi:hypothetical protein
MACFKLFWEGDKEKQRVRCRMEWREESSQPLYIWEYLLVYPRETLRQILGNRYLAKIINKINS